MLFRVWVTNLLTREPRAGQQPHLAPVVGIDQKCAVGHLHMMFPVWIVWCLGKITSAHPTPWSTHKPPPSNRLIL